MFERTSGQLRFFFPGKNEGVWREREAVAEVFAQKPASGCTIGSNGFTSSVRGFLNDEGMNPIRASIFKKLFQMYTFYLRVFIAMTTELIFWHNRYFCGCTGHRHNHEYKSCELALYEIIHRILEGLRASRNHCTVSNMAQQALKTVQIWCRKEGVTVNLTKTSDIAFTRRRNH